MHLTIKICWGLCLPGWQKRCFGVNITKYLEQYNPHSLYEEDGGQKCSLGDLKHYGMTCIKKYWGGKASSC